MRLTHPSFLSLLLCQPPLPLRSPLLWPVLWMWLSASLLLGCNSERDQALALVARVNAIDVSAPVTERQPQLEALESLRLQDEALVSVQSLCASAHRALIDAEVAQAKARHSLDTAEADATPATRLNHAKTIAAEIARSTRKLEQAQGTFPECERQARELSLRFPKSAP